MRSNSCLRTQLDAIHRTVSNHRTPLDFPIEKPNRNPNDPTTTTPSLQIWTLVKSICRLIPLLYLANNELKPCQGFDFLETPDQEIVSITTKLHNKLQSYVDTCYCQIIVCKTGWNFWVTLGSSGHNRSFIRSWTFLVPHSHLHFVFNDKIPEATCKIVIRINMW